MAFTLSRRARTLIGSATLAILAALLLLALLPVAWFKDEAEAALSRHIGVAVTIGTIKREDVLSLTPVIRVTDITVRQAPWAGNGNLATIGVLRLRLSTVDMLVGRGNPSLLSASGVTLNLVRGVDKRVNWRSGEFEVDNADTDLTQLDTLDSVINFKDAWQDRQFTVAVRLDPKSGLVASGTGTISGYPVTVRARASGAASGRWPFDVAIKGDALAFEMRGTMAKPLDFAHMQFNAKAHARDLKLIDRIIEAGLFGTQPVKLDADVEREGESWTIRHLSGTIGGSDITGNARVARREGKTSLDATLHSRRLDVEDLASDAGIAAALALEREEGLRVVPNIRINLAKVGLNSGRVAFTADRIVSSRRPSALTSISGVLNLDGKLLVAEPLEIGLKKGKISGSVTVDQRQGRTAPLVTMALDLRGSDVAALFGGNGAVTAPVDAKVRLTGIGNTVRETVGQSDGRIGIMAGQGALPEKLAVLMGFDVGRTLFTDDEDRAVLRCAAMDLEVHQGTATATALVVDTSRSQANGRGTIGFPEERLSLAFAGAPKVNTVLRVPGWVRISGTVRDPKIMIPRKVSSAGNILKGIGRAITGRQGPKATNADCHVLRSRIVG